MYVRSMKYPSLSLISIIQKPKYISLTKTTSTGILLTTLYTKQIKRQSYLHRKSEHAETLKRSIPYSQALRLKRICATTEDSTDQSNVLANRLVERGYNKNEIQQEISKTFTIKQLIY